MIDMQSALCDAFCGNLHVDKVMAGWLVTTPFTMPDGDPVRFYIMDSVSGMVWLEDDGTQVGMLEAEGVILEKGSSRREDFDFTMASYGASYDDQTGLICSERMPRDQVAIAAVKFMSLMMRIQDFALLSVERVRNAWFEDVVRKIHQAYDNVAKIEENAPVSSEFSNWPADVVIRKEGTDPTAIFFATSNSKGLQALVLKMELEKYQQVPCRVILIVERPTTKTISEPTYALSQSRLDRVLSYVGAEGDMVNAIGKTAGIEHGTVQ